jgi:general secretion pathway protein J
MQVRNTVERCKGFTLLELLVSIMILSLIVTISYSALRLGSKSWEGAIRVINKSSDIRSTVQVIRKKLEQIYPIYWKQDNKRILSFLGDEDGMRFIAPSPEGREVGEYYEYYLVANRGASGNSLVLFYAPHNPDSEYFEVSKNSSNRIILDDLNTISFSYFGYQDQNKDATWNEYWNDDASSFPSLIQIKITGKNNLDLALDLIIRIRSGIYIS